MIDFQKNTVFSGLQLKLIKQKAKSRDGKKGSLAVRMQPTGDVPLKLSTPRSDRAILEELEGWIRGGRLEPGQRLPSIKAIQKMLKVGQRSVEMALDSLAERGLIETKNRSGNYLVPNARDRLSGEGTKSMQSSWVLSHYLPKTDLRTLTVYTIDCMGKMKGVWNEFAREYGGGHDIQVRLLTPNDGHLLELLRHEHVDVAHSTPEVLQSIGWDKFVNLEPLQQFDDLSAEVVPQVRARMKDAWNRHTLPFAITVMYLFFNRTMAAKFGIADKIPSDPFEFLEWIKKAHTLLRPSGFDAMQIPSLADFLMMSGGLSFSPDGRVVMDQRQAKRCVDALAGSHLALPNPLEIPDAFAAGNTLTMRHASFTCSELLEQANFDWQAHPTPLALGTRDMAWLTLLAVPESSQRQKEAFDLVEVLLSESVQNKFASIGGNLPVRRSALTSVVEADVNHVHAETIHRALAQSELTWPHVAWGKFFNLEFYEATTGLLTGEVSPSEVLQLVKSQVDRVSVT